MKANTIDEVIQQLDIIINDCIQKSSRIGYFASLYKAMTIGVKVGIEQDAFDNGPRMELLDVAFANRYLTAYNQFSTGQVATHSWMHAFKAAEQTNLSIVQHLLLGINAHINLDLGIAAAAISTAGDIESLHHDFNLINVVIGNVYLSLEKQLKKISWPTIFLKSLDPTVADDIVNFSIQKARDTAWSNAVILADSTEIQDEDIIRATDTIVSKVATCVQNPDGITKWIIKGILLFESNDVAKNIKVLNEG
ncbi:hypothetical protein F0919_01565 [Taibaiella lutea]|uniref:Uncharacterized protein n=1 Tax=Taibaiella lutea TaxID=2608001 RepID=A0A5M6CMV7_9BACT|nr:DUF5995 family protein [Taibaiella lutea]KAA5536383.1 hypothetical protein F0919_01565 [Taibaiella lutea]